MIATYVFVSLFLAYEVNAAPNILKGPSTKTTVVGPDGSKIEAYAPGGQINLEEHGALVQEAPKVVLHAASAEVAAEGVQASEVTNVDVSGVLVPQVIGKEAEFPRAWPGGIEVKVVVEEPRVVKVPAVFAEAEILDDVVEAV